MGLSACYTPKAEEIDSLPPNQAFLGVMQFLADSVATCDTWLEKDYRIRKFFANSDSVADLLTENFTHDQIVDWFRSLDTTGVPELSPFLRDLHLQGLASKDSIQTCANAINALAFSHDGNEALLLFVEIDSVTETAYTLLLEQPQEGGWYIADTLSISR